MTRERMHQRRGAANDTALSGGILADCKGDELYAAVEMDSPSLSSTPGHSPEHKRLRASTDTVILPSCQAQAGSLKSLKPGKHAFDTSKLEERTKMLHAGAN